MERLLANFNINSFFCRTPFLVSALSLASCNLNSVISSSLPSTDTPPATIDFTVVVEGDLSADSLIEVEGGSPPYAISFPEGSGTYNEQTKSFTPNVSGVIPITITDSKNNQASGDLKVDMEPVSTNIVSQYYFAQGEESVFVVSDLNTESHNELFKISLADFSNNRISEDPTTGRGFVYDFQISESTSKIVYRMDAQVNYLRDLFVVDLDGSNGSQINDTTNYNYSGGQISNQGVQSDYEITNNNQVIYRDGNHSLFVDNEMRVQGVDLDGSNWKYITPAIPGGADKSVEGMYISPSGNWVVADLMWYESYYSQAFAFPSDGSLTSFDNRLHMPITAFGQQFDKFSSVNFSSDSKWVFTPVRYDISGDGTDMYRLYSTDLETDPTTAVLLGKNLRFSKVSPDDSRVLVSELEKVGFSINTKDFLIMDPNGSNSVSLGFTINSITFTSDSARFIYKKDGDDTLYSRLSDGSGEVTLSPGAITSYVLDSNNTVYFLTFNASKNLYELFSVDADGTQLEEITQVDSLSDPKMFKIDSQNRLLLTNDDDSDGDADSFYLFDKTTDTFLRFVEVIPEGETLQDVHISSTTKKLYISTKVASNKYKLYYAGKLPE